MKVVIWLCCIIVYIVVDIILHDKGIMLGALPAMFMTLILVIVPASALCKLWEKRKRKNNLIPQEDEMLGIQPKMQLEMQSEKLNDISEKQLKAISKKALIAIIVSFSFCCILITVVGVYLARNSGYNDGWSEGYSSAEKSERDRYIKLLTYNENELKKARSAIEDSKFWLTHIGIIVQDGSKNYHKPGSSCIEAYGEWMGHNIEYCNYLGYTGCPICANEN